MLTKNVIDEMSLQVIYIYMMDINGKSFLYITYNGGYAIKP